MRRIHKFGRRFLAFLAFGSSEPLSGAGRPSVKGRSLRLEVLEDRRLLSVDLIRNGGFGGAVSPSDWATTGAFHADSRFANYHNSPGYAYLSNADGSAGNNLIGSMYQQFTVPATARSVTLAYWYNITTTETGGTANDFLNVTIQNSSGQYLAGVGIYSNLNSGTIGAYREASYDLSSLKGQTLRLNFLGTTNGSYPTTFRIDDVSVVATVPAAAPSITTVSPTSMPPSTSPQSIKVYGSSFDTSSSHLLFTDPQGNVYTSANHSYYETRVSSSEFDYQIDNNSDTGTWKVEVQNPDGQVSNLVSFAVAAPVSAPAVSTAAASSVTANTAVLNGTVNPNGASTSAYFQYGTTTSYGYTSQAQTGITTATSVQTTLTGLAAGTTYHYRLVASNSGGTSYGGDMSFTTMNAAVTLTLYVRAGSTSGPLLPGAKVMGQDAVGNTFSQTANAGGYVVLTGIPGMWQFAVSASGYPTNTWGQSITATETKTAYLIQQVTATKHLAFLQQPTDATAGSVITPAVVVAIEDSGNNIIASDNSNITLTLNPGTTTFTVAAVNGKATFSTLTVSTAGAYTLQANDGSDVPTTSMAFAVATSPRDTLISALQALEKAVSDYQKACITAFASADLGLATYATANSQSKDLLKNVLNDLATGPNGVANAAKVVFPNPADELNPLTDVFLPLAEDGASWLATCMVENSTGLKSNLGDLKDYFTSQLSSVTNLQAELDSITTEITTKASLSLDGCPVTAITNGLSDLAKKFADYSPAAQTPRVGDVGWAAPGYGVSVSPFELGATNTVDQYAKNAAQIVNAGKVASNVLTGAGYLLEGAGLLSGVAPVVAVGGLVGVGSGLISLAANAEAAYGESTALHWFNNDVAQAETVFDQIADAVKNLAITPKATYSTSMQVLGPLSIADVTTSISNFGTVHVVVPVSNNGTASGQVSGVLDVYNGSALFRVSNTGGVQTVPAGACGQLEFTFDLPTANQLWQPSATDFTTGVPQWMLPSQITYDAQCILVDSAGTPTAWSQNSTTFQATSGALRWMDSLGQNVGNAIVQAGQTISGVWQSASNAVQDIFALNYPGSDMDLRVYDSAGEYVGYDYATGQVHLGISDAQYYSAGPGSPEYIAVPVSGNAQFYVEANAVQTSGSEGASVSVDEVVSHPATLGISAGEVTIGGAAGGPADFDLGIGEIGGQEGLIGVGVSISDLLGPGGLVIPASAITFSAPPTTISAGAESDVEFQLTAPSTVGTYQGTIQVTTSNGGNYQVPVEVDVLATPVFSNLSASSVIGVGTPSVVLSGTISAGTLIPPSTETVAIAVNGVTYTAPIDSQGNFSAVIDTSQLPVSAMPYPVTYTYAGDTTFSSVSDSTTTTLTVQLVSTPASPIRDLAWQYQASMPQPLINSLGAVVNGKIHVIGGNIGTAHYCYDPSSNAWATLASPPAPISDGGAVVVNSKIYAIGYFGTAAVTEIYDPASNTWTTGAAMPTPRDYTAVAAVSGKVYVIGGWSSGNAVGTVEVYDPASNTWTDRTPMPTARGAAAVAALNGLIYVVGGSSSDPSVCTVVQAYNPATDTWTTRAPLSVSRIGAGAVALGGKLFVLSGYDGSGTPGQHDWSSIAEYDPDVDSWNYLPSGLLTPRDSAVVGVVNGTPYIIGGESWGNGNLSSVEEGIPRDYFSIIGATSAMAGQPVTFTVTALTYGNLTDTSYNGTIHFTSSDTQAVLPADAALAAGVGTFTVTFGTAGCQTLTATDVAIGSITGTTGLMGGDPVTVSPAAATHLGVSVWSNPIRNSAFSFTVTALDQFNNTSATYAGKVHFTSSDTQATLPADAKLASGIGTFNATLAAVGSQTLTATDTANAGITGGTPVTVIAGIPTSTALSVSATSSTVGQAITLTATVEVVPPNTGTPSAGTVTFMDGTTALGLAPVSAGTATLVVNSLTVGTHVLTADYSGSGTTFADSRSGVNPDSLISTIAGDGSSTYGGDGGPATAAMLYQPRGIAVDGNGDIFIADMCDNRVRRVDASTGVITTIAGTGNSGYSGDNGLATAATLSNPSSVAVDASGHLLYISDDGNSCVRKVDLSTGVITTVPSSEPGGLALDSNGNLFIADGTRIRKIAVSTGVVTTVAGQNGSGFSGDGGPATSALLSGASSVALDAAGNIYIADTNNERVRKVAASTGNITTVAGMERQCTTATAAMPQRWLCTPQVLRSMRADTSSSLTNTISESARSRFRPVQLRPLPATEPRVMAATGARRRQRCSTGR